MFLFCRNILLSLFFPLLFCANEVLACYCGVLPINAAVEKSTYVFSGKVIGFEYRKGIPSHFVESQATLSGERFEYETKVVKLQVLQWWKGNALAVLYIVTETIKISDGKWITSSCDYDFKEGETYLIYASGAENELRTSFCTRTRKISDAGEDLKLLGVGTVPLKP